MGVSRRHCCCCFSVDLLARLMPSFRGLAGFRLRHVPARQRNVVQRLHGRAASVCCRCRLTQQPLKSAVRLFLVCVRQRYQSESFRRVILSCPPFVPYDPSSLVSSVYHAPFDLCAGCCENEQTDPRPWFVAQAHARASFTSPSTPSGPSHKAPRLSWDRA